MPRRLNRLMENANSTLYSVQDLVAFAKAFLADLADGVRIDFVRLPNSGTLFDFVMGKTERFPVSVSLVFEEKDEDGDEEGDAAATTAEPAEPVDENDA
jgi:hypothetical protein